MEDLTEFSRLTMLLFGIFLIFYSYLILYIFGNYKESSKKEKTELEERKVKAWEMFIDLTGYPIYKNDFVWLNYNVIETLFLIHTQGVVTKEDIIMIKTWFSCVENDYQHEQTIYFNMQGYKLSNLVYAKYVIENNMLLSSDKFLQCFFRFGDFYRKEKEYFKL